MTCKEYANSEEQTFNIFKKGVTASSLKGRKPTPILPKGLDTKRQWYLYDEIRPFCSTNLAKDVTCPKPSVPRPDAAPEPKRPRKKT